MNQRKLPLKINAQLLCVAVGFIVTSFTCREVSFKLSVIIRTDAERFDDLVLGIQFGLLSRNMVPGSKQYYP